MREVEQHIGFNQVIEQIKFWSKNQIRSKPRLGLTEEFGVKLVTWDVFNHNGHVGMDRTEAIDEIADDGGLGFGPIMPGQEGGVIATAPTSREGHADEQKDENKAIYASFKSFVRSNHRSSVHHVHPFLP